MVVITGASDGLGLELAKLYNKAGTTAVNLSRRPCPHAAKNLLHDLQNGKEVIAAADNIMALKEPLEAVVNCAGVLTIEPLGEISEAEITRTMATNVMAPIMLVSRLIERIKADGTDIVNVSSAMAAKPRTDHTVYLASKWALRGFSTNLQAELAKYPSRVISFCPGGFQTDIYKKLTGQDSAGGKGALMSAADVAVCLKQLLDLPKNMEASEIILNRKKS